jgi:hypothetical protein
MLCCTHPLLPPTAPQAILVNRLMDQQLCLAEEQAVARVADAAAFGDVQKLQVGVMPVLVVPMAAAATAQLQETGPDNRTRRAAPLPFSNTQALAVFVAERLGGPAREEELAAAYAGTSARCKAQAGRSVILLLGSLHLGTSRHRCLLFKALADELGLAACILRGQGTEPADAAAAAAAAAATHPAAAFGDPAAAADTSGGRAPALPGLRGRGALVCVLLSGVGYHLDLLGQPGTLTPLRPGLPVVRPSECSRWARCVRRQALPCWACRRASSLWLC